MAGQMTHMEVAYRVADKMGISKGKLTDKVIVYNKND